MSEMRFNYNFNAPDFTPEEAAHWVHSYEVSLQRLRAGDVEPVAPAVVAVPRYFAPEVEAILRRQKRQSPLFDKARRGLLALAEDLGGSLFPPDSDKDLPTPYIRAVFGTGKRSNFGFFHSNYVALVGAVETPHFARLAHRTESMNYLTFVDGKNQPLRNPHISYDHEDRIQTLLDEFAEMKKSSPAA